MITKSVSSLLMVFWAIFLKVQAARILVFLPTASISHQIVIRDFTQELAKRGHDVVVITSDPVFTKGKAPANLREIDVHDAAYTAKHASFAETVTGRNDDLISQITKFFQTFRKLFEAEIKTPEVQDLINDRNQKFDLLILEACVKPVLIFSHIFKAPVILFSSLGTIEMFNEYAGSVSHPLLYPIITHQRIYNLTLWEKAFELYKHFTIEMSIRDLEKGDDEMLQRMFGPDVPPLKELKKNVDMLFLTEHHLWDNNRPVPPNVVYVGGIYPKYSTGELPQDLQKYLDSSTNGVIYMSFGTTVFPSLLPQNTIKTILNVLSQLPYDVMLKWDTDKLAGISKNVKLFKWVPQSDVLRHPNIKLFINQGGLQSTDDAIAAGVPLIGMPMLGDQWYNGEQYVRLKIGLRLDVESLTKKKMLEAINTVIEDASYRNNVLSLRTILRDQPQTALDRAVWWAEHVIRHKGARHLRAPTALISYWDYYELDLVIVICLCVFLVMVLLALVVYGLVLIGCNKFKKTKVE